MERKIRMLKLSAIGSGIGVVGFLSMMMNLDKGQDFEGVLCLVTAVLLLITGARAWARYTELLIDYKLHENRNNDQSSLY